ncbi:hypothetical protein CIG2463D_1052 [Campylobacter iguaniorum]|uniref:Uncharacterized protein n=1 Tax=Campylobacter iguaniorum TaxID=1244531 RepID=A0A076FA73_9BACT|nr:hypothetical protein [Campylobacter iguaniorum]AII14836.1 hypothetical protein CIG1485E_0999 [Campylobacter iguaniorum]ALV24624.1 hypothetical protein CIG2463D_1052 [Campylobacter iguaniorum]
MKKQIFATAILAAVFIMLIASIDFGVTSTLVRHGNTAKIALTDMDFNKSKYLCSETKAPIKEYENSAQAVRSNGDTYFFTDITNLFTWLIRQKDKDSITTWVYTQDTKKYVPAKNAWYSRVDITPMGYGIAAYEYHLHGVSDSYYDEVVLFAARGETLINPLINILLTENRI